MQLKFLIGDACPVCGETTIVTEKLKTSMVRGETQVLRHTSGAQWEFREFSCGQELPYVPNFSRTMPSDYRVCRRDPKILARRAEIERVQSLLEESLAVLGESLEDADRERILKGIRSVEMPWRPA